MRRCRRDPTHEFALVAIDEGVTTATALGRRLSVSKQAAAKMIAVLEQLDYLGRMPDPDGARSKCLRVTDRGHEMAAIGATTFDQLRTACGPRPPARRTPDDRERARPTRQAPKNDPLNRSHQRPGEASAGALTRHPAERPRGEDIRFAGVALTHRSRA